MSALWFWVFTASQVFLWVWPIYYLWQASVHLTRGLLHRAVAYQLRWYAKRRQIEHETCTQVR